MHRSVVRHVLHEFSFNVRDRPNLPIPGCCIYFSSHSPLMPREKLPKAKVLWLQNPKFFVQTAHVSVKVDNGRKDW